MGHKPLFIGIGHKKQQGRGAFAEMLRSLIGSSCTFDNFAKPLKMLAMEAFGLSYRQCVDSDANKNSMATARGNSLPIWRHQYGLDGADDFLTVRQVHQHLGVSMRQSFPGNWRDAPFRKVRSQDEKVVIITDVRFED